MHLIKELTKAQKAALAKKAEACAIFANKLNAIVTLRNGKANNVEWGINTEGNPVLLVHYPSMDLGLLEVNESKEILKGLSDANVTVVINLAEEAV